MWPCFSRLSSGRQEALGLLYKKIGFLGIVSNSHLIAAVERGNIERVCDEIGDSEISERYRKG